MQKALIALTVAALSLGTLATADAKGNGGADQRKALKQAIAEARANSADTSNSGGFFSSLFGGGDEKDRAKEATKEVPTDQTSN